MYAAGRTYKENGHEPTTRKKMIKQEVNAMVQNTIYDTLREDNIENKCKQRYDLL